MVPNRATHQICYFPYSNVFCNLGIILESLGAWYFVDLESDWVSFEDFLIVIMLFWRLSSNKLLVSRTCKEHKSL